MQSEQADSSPDELDHREYLFHLKKCVESWFFAKRDHIAACSNNEDSCLRIVSLIKSILLDGFCAKDVKDYESSVSSFIENLNWLHPRKGAGKSCSSSFKITISASERPLIFDDLSDWICENLEKSQLCEKLKLLISDFELLRKYYTAYAYLRSERYSCALLIGLSAIELNQSSLLSQIDESLYCQRQIVSRHKRSISHPHFSISPKKSDSCQDPPLPCSSGLGKQMKNIDTGSLHKIENGKRYNVDAMKKKMELKPWRSLPDMRQTVEPFRNRRAYTIANRIDVQNRFISRSTHRKGEKVQKFALAKCSETDSALHDVASTSRCILTTPDLIPIHLVKCDDIEIHVDQRQMQRNNARTSNVPESSNEITYDSPPCKKRTSHMNLLSCLPIAMFSPTEDAMDDIAKAKSIYANLPSTSNDFVSVFLPRDGEKLNRCNRSFLNGEIDESTATKLDSLRLPQSGETIASLLQAALARNNTDLERENAHFNLSEAMISAIGHIKWTNMQRRRKEALEALKSHEEQVLASQIKKIHKRMAKIQSWSDDRSSATLDFWVDYCIYSGESSTSDSEMSSSSEMNSEPNIEKTSNSMQSINDHTAFAEWGESQTDALSAEGVALSLLSKFSDTQLPSDLSWLISKQDVFQEYSSQYKSNMTDDRIMRPLTRGTTDWAPPRPQIIFTVHPPVNRKDFMEKQNHRCAGCGMRIAPAHIHRYRYCYYFGKYHCSGCHRNQISTIPANVIQSWDFSRYPVSMFAYRLIDQMWNYPLFYLPDLNDELYKKIKKLEIVRKKRMQLKYIRDYVMTCRFAVEEGRMVECIPSHLFNDPDMWAMSDFVATKDVTLRKCLDDLIVKCEQHIFNCELCSVRGFLCEICPEKVPIYPWQVKVARCKDCGTCYHEKCWNATLECLKCQRLKERKQKKNWVECNDDT